nr:MAG TPA: hypothetical protein [Caudoviricetes sp.]
MKTIMNILSARVISIIVASLLIILCSVLFKLNFVVMLISFTTFRTGLYIFNKIIGKE